MRERPMGGKSDRWRVGRQQLVAEGVVGKRPAHQRKHMKLPVSRERASFRDAPADMGMLPRPGPYVGRTRPSPHAPSCLYACPACARLCGAPRAHPSIHSCLSRWEGRFRRCWRLSLRRQLRYSPAGLHVGERCRARQGSVPGRPLLRFESHCRERRPRDGGACAARIADQHAVAAANVGEEHALGALKSSKGWAVQAHEPCGM